MKASVKENIQFHNRIKKGKAIMSIHKSIRKSLLNRSSLVLRIHCFYPSLRCFIQLSQRKGFLSSGYFRGSHLPGRNISEKEKVIQIINSWGDVDRVVALGDICSELGTANELKYAQEFFSQLQKPLWVIAGNHDYIYDDYLNSEGRIKRGSSRSQQYKLQRFAKGLQLAESLLQQKAWGLLAHFHLNR